jgi:hypothetical protein
MSSIEDWLKSQGSAPQRRGIFDAPVPGKPVPKGGDKPAASPAPSASSGDNREPLITGSSDIVTGSKGTGLPPNDLHREGSFPEVQGSLDFE